MYILMYTYKKNMKILKLFVFTFILLGAGLLFSVEPALAIKDLQVAEINVAPNAPAFNEPVVITVKVLNNGDETLLDNTGLDSIDVNFYGFDQTRLVMPNVTVDAPLEPTKSVNYTIEGWFYSIGKKNVSFTVDKNDNLDEWRESNNTNYVQITVVEQYDVSIKSIDVFPENPAAGQECVVTVTAENSGYAKFRTSIGLSSYSYSFDDFILIEEIVPEISSDNPVLSGEEFEHVYRGKFNTEGTKSLHFSIDNGDQLSESNEDNNELTVSKTIVSPTAIDIGITKIELSNTSPVTNEEVTITITVVNTGSVTLVSDAGFRYDADISVFPIIEQEVNYTFDDFDIEGFSASGYPSFASPLLPSKEFTYAYTGVFFNNAGERNLNFRINTGDRLRDTDKANNSVSHTVYVYGNAAARDAFEITNVNAEFYSSSSVRLYWQTSKKATANADYKKKLFTGWVETGGSTDTLIHTRDVTGLEPDMWYDWRIFASLGTQEREKLDLNFTMPTNDSIKITSGPRVVTQTGQATVSWDTSLLANEEVYYRLKGTVDYTAKKSSDLTSEHEVILTGLTGNTYDYYMVSENNAGHKVESVPLSFTVGTGTGEPETPIETPLEETEEATEEVTELSPTNQAIISNQAMYQQLRGKIILTVEQNGEAYYINPNTETRHYLGRPDDAFSVMRGEGIGITNENLSLVPIGMAALSGPDTDSDGLSDMFEDAIGTDKNQADSDGDGFNDNAEVTGGYDPLGAGTMIFDQNFTNDQYGKIFLQVENNGEAWYVNPADNKRYFLGRPADAFSIMRTLGLGISNSDFENL